MTQKKYAPYFSNFDWPWYMPTIDEYEKILKRFSFKEVKVWSENADNYFANEQEMIRWIEQPSLVPFLKCVAKSDKQTFRDTVIEQMIKNTAQPDGRCFETFRRINVLAKK